MSPHTEAKRVWRPVGVATQAAKYVDNQNRVKRTTAYPLPDSIETFQHLTYLRKVSPDSKVRVANFMKVYVAKCFSFHGFGAKIVEHSTEFTKDI